MERYCSTGQSPQRAVAPTEEEEEPCFPFPSLDRHSHPESLGGNRPTCDGQANLGGHVHWTVRVLFAGTSAGMEDSHVTYYNVWRHHELADEKRYLYFNLSHHNFC